jgi:hypothetical protein
MSECSLMHVLPPAPDNVLKHDHRADIVTAMWLGPATPSVVCKCAGEKTANGLNALAAQYASVQSEHFCVGMNTTRHEFPAEASDEPLSRSMLHWHARRKSERCSPASGKSTMGAIALIAPTIDRARGASQRAVRPRKRRYLTHPAGVPVWVKVRQEQPEKRSCGERPLC